MKKSLLFLLMIVALISCKRKQNLRDIDGRSKLASGPSTCYNGLLDGDEIAIDCGGSCTSCNFPAAPCSPGDNTFKIGPSTYTTAATAPTFGGSNYKFNGTYSGGTYSIILWNTIVPDMTKPYPITTTGPADDEAYVSIHQTAPSDYFIPTSGEVYITMSGGKYVAIICGASGNYTAGTPVYSFEAKFSNP